MTAAPVVVIKAFEVPEIGDEVFLAGLDPARAHLAAPDGYLSTRLHQSLSADMDFRFVKVERSASAHAFQVASSQRGMR